MKKIIAIIFIFQLSVVFTAAQDYGGNNVGLANFVKRMYNVQPFEGVKLFQTQDGNNYMISVISLKADSSKPDYLLNKIASIKAKAYASQYLNGTDINSEFIVITDQQKTKDSVVVKTLIREVIKESSVGFISDMELLTKFKMTDKNSHVYVYYKEIKK